MHLHRQFMEQKWQNLLVYALLLVAAQAARQMHLPEHQSTFFLWGILGQQNHSFLNLLPLLLSVALMLPDVAPPLLVSLLLLYD